MKEIKLIVVGFGKIGRSVADVLLAKKEFLAKKYGLKFNVVAIAEKDGSIVNERGIDLRKALTVRLNKNPGWNSKKSLYLLSM